MLSYYFVVFKLVFVPGSGGDPLVVLHAGIVGYLNTVFVCHSPFDLKAKYPRMVPFLSLSLCSLFSIPGNPIYLNSLNDRLNKSAQFFAYISHLFKRYGYNVSSN